MSSASSYWCYRCSRLVRAWPQDSIVCPDCDSGFLEEVSIPPRFVRHRRPDEPSPPRIRRHRRGGAGDRSPFNPVIVLRGPADSAANPNADRFELYYDDGAGSGLRPLPPTMSEFLMGSGFERLLDQLAQIEMNGVGGRRFENPPAAKAAVESMPKVEILGSDFQCAVCMEAMDSGGEGREMPCKHVYHQDCIFAWLAMRNSCPVCRHQMPMEQGEERSPARGGDEETVGLTIWRLPGGGFAVGRFSSGGSPGERRQLPVVYTEMDGGFNSGGAARRIAWSEGERREQRRGGIGGVFRNLFSFFRRRRGATAESLDFVAAERQGRSRVLRFNSGLSSVRQ